MSNPILNSERFSQQENVLDSEPMTIQGTISKVIMLFVCLLAGAGLSVYYILSGQASTVMSLTIILSLVAFILVMITCFNVKTSKYLAPPYALCEGFVLGGISAFFESAMQGIVLQTVIITFAVLFVMLMLYKAKLIQYTERMRTVLTISLLSICAVYLVQFIVSMFGLSIPGIFGNGPIGILFSLVVVGIASFSLIQDFYFIENASQRMLSKDYEWYGALGLMVTLVWLYMEILRLLAKLNSRR
jgi:uncharacterized YccA/Bax inhibitor family protein